MTNRDRYCFCLKSIFLNSSQLPWRSGTVQSVRNFHSFMCSHRSNLCRAAKWSQQCVFTVNPQWTTFLFTLSWRVAVCWTITCVSKVSPNNSLHPRKSKTFGVFLKNRIQTKAHTALREVLWHATHLYRNANGIKQALNFLLTLHEHSSLIDMLSALSFSRPLHNRCFSHSSLCTHSPSLLQLNNKKLFSCLLFDSCPLNRWVRARSRLAIIVHA